MLSLMGRWEPNARERLIRAALDLFTEQGYDATTVSEIAERAGGLTKTTFFRHFPDKREVLFAAGQDVHGRLVADAIAAAAESVASGEHDDEFPLDVFQTGSGWWLIVGEVCGKGPEAAAITALVRHSVRALAFTEEDPGRVLGSVNRVMLSHELEETARRLLPVEVLLAVIECPPAVRAAGEEGPRSRGVDLVKLPLDDPVTQGWGALDVDPPAAAAAADVKTDMPGGLARLDAHRPQHPPRGARHAALADQLAGIVESGHTEIGRAQLEPSVGERLGEVLGDVTHLERQRLANELRGLPAQRGIRMTAFRDDQHLGLAGARLLDQPQADLALPCAAASVVAVVLRDQTVAAKRAISLQMRHHARQGGDGGRIMLDIRAGHGQHHLRLRLVDGHLHVELPPDGQEPVAVRLAGVLRLSRAALVRRLFVQLLRRETRFEQTASRLFDELGDVDAHRADERAPAAHVAAVEQQVLPALELIGGDLRLQGEPAEERGVLRVERGPPRPVVGWKVRRRDAAVGLDRLEPAVRQAAERITSALLDVDPALFESARSPFEPFQGRDPEEVTRDLLGMLGDLGATNGLDTGGPDVSGGCWLVVGSAGEIPGTGGVMPVTVATATPPRVPTASAVAASFAAAWACSSASAATRCCSACSLVLAADSSASSLALLFLYSLPNIVKSFEVD